jgi:hypothetical protein
MSKPQPIPTRPDADEPEQIDAETRRILEDRLATFDADAKAARPAADVVADLRARRPLPASPR